MLAGSVGAHDDRSLLQGKSTVMLESLRRMIRAPWGCMISVALRKTALDVCQSRLVCQD